MKSSSSKATSRAASASRRAPKSSTPTPTSARRLTKLSPRSRQHLAASKPAETARPSLTAQPQRWSARVAYAKSRAKQPLARIAAVATVGVPPEIMAIAPAPAIRLLLERTGMKLESINRFEINEAFAAQIIGVERELNLDRAKLNVNGGAIAIGHPLAATGIRLSVTLARELRRAKLRYGIGSACIGGGQGIAILLENAA